MRKFIVFLLLGVMLVFNSIVAAQEGISNDNINNADRAIDIKESDNTAVNRWILVNIPARALRLYENDKCIAMYPVGVGTINTKTPVGYYKIIEKVVNPAWTDPDDLTVVISSGPDNPLGYRWLGIGGNYGIHGTNRPDSVGHYVSNGCIRMIEKDVEKVFDKVEVGTPVQIIYNRLVIDKTFDNRVAYYIYPDGYNMQNLTVDFVKQGLKGYGVADFVSNEDIAQAIKLENGQPNYVAAPVNIIFNGKKLDFKAVNYQNLIYVPAMNLAKTLNNKVEIKENQIISDKGSAKVNFYNNVAYMRLTDVPNVFNYMYNLNKNVTEIDLEPIQVDSVSKQTNQKINTDIVVEQEKSGENVKNNDLKKIKEDNKQKNSEDLTVKSENKKDINKVEKNKD